MDREAENVGAKILPTNFAHSLLILNNPKMVLITHKIVGYSIKFWVVKSNAEIVSVILKRGFYSTFLISGQ